MSMTTPSRARRALASLATAALVLTAGVSSLAVPALAAPAAAAADRTVALVGSLQSELGCSADWQPECDATELAPTGDDGRYAAEFEVPAGTWEYKVALDDAWDEAYGLDGTDANIPLTIAGPARLRFVFDATLQRVGVEALDLTGGYSDADDALVAEPVRQPGAEEQFYFVMTDRFANGDPTNDTGGLEGDRLATGLDPSDSGFYHGGDIAGLRQNLDYIEGLGTSAIWS